VEEYTEEVRWLKVKMEFIQAFIDGHIVFKDNTKKQVATQILGNTSALDSDINRLLALSILTLTKEEIVKLQKQINETNKTLEFWNTTTPKDQFISDLEGINN
jgi:hypothetical protein